MRRARALLRARPADRGTTLIELLVSMAIFSLCMTLVFGAVILVMRKSTDVQKSADAVSELRIALAQIDRQVRSGNVLFSPADESAYVTSCTGDAATNSGTCMRIFTQSNGSEKCVQWQITGDPADANPRVNCILPTSASALTSRASRVMFQSLTAEIGVNAFGSSLYYMLDNCIVRGRAGQEASSVAAFTAAPPAGQWSAAIVRTRWWRTASFIGAGNSRFGLMRNCEASRSVANTLVAIKNRLIPAAEDGLVGALVFTASASLPALAAAKLAG